MDDKPTTEEGLVEEFQALGKNLMEALQAAWETPESKRVQEQVLAGLEELGSTLKKEADNFAASPAGQQFKTGVEQVGERLRSVEVQDKVRQDLLTALQSANAELKKVINRWTETSSTTAEGSSASQETARDPED
jgi:hypothetical protein